MASQAPKLLPKPVLKGFYSTFLKKVAAATFVLSGVVPVSWHVLYTKPFYEKWDQFIKTTDPDKMMDDLMKAGAFYSITPKGEIVNTLEDD